MSFDNTVRALHLSRESHLYLRGAFHLGSSKMPSDCEALVKDYPQSILGDTVNRYRFSIGADACDTPRRIECTILNELAFSNTFREYM